MPKQSRDIRCSQPGFVLFQSIVFYEAKKYFIPPGMKITIRVGVENFEVFLTLQQAHRFINLLLYRNEQECVIPHDEITVDDFQRLQENCTVHFDDAGKLVALTITKNGCRFDIPTEV